MIITSKITRAIEFCCEQHQGQKRLATEIPFASHPISVGFILHSAGYPEEVIIAGILHDILEDTLSTEDDIRKIFGEKIVTLVRGVTEDITIKVLEKKQRIYLENLKISENNIKAISAADLLDNCRSMIRVMERGINIWKSFSVSPEKKIKYTRERLNIIKETLQNEITKEIEISIDKLESLKDF